MKSVQPDSPVSSAASHLATILRSFGSALLFGLLISLSGAAAADGGGESYAAVANMMGTAERYKMPRTLRRREASGEMYAWGVAEQSADDFTRMTGWRLSDSWHFGYQQGLESGLSLLWQGERDQMSVSADGIRFTRRF